jgi:5-methylcytosine-specific restriction endonuclease McrA
MGVFMTLTKQARYKQKWRAVYFWLLTEILGGICVECGEQRTKKLTVDHVHGKNYDATGLSNDQRARIYLREYNEGVKLQCLCHSCNSRKGHPDATSKLPF